MDGSTGQQIEASKVDILSGSVHDLTFHISLVRIVSVS